ncbi:MAG: CZB domain-containing protein [Sterolibacterium sp.]|jgi:hypothetical protein
MPSLLLQSAIRDHHSWRERFEFSITGMPSDRFDFSTAGDHAICPLGKWLLGDGLKFSDCPNYAELVDIHAKFHGTAAHIVKLIGEGKREAAREILEGEFSTLSLAIVRQIQQLRQCVKAN